MDRDLLKGGPRQAVENLNEGRSQVARAPAVRLHLANSIHWTEPESIIVVILGAIATAVSGHPVRDIPS